MTVEKTQKLDFSNINKSSSQSFNAQKKLIKQLFSGKSIQCQTCQQPLQLVLPTQNNTESTYGVFCKKGCTDIQLEFEM